MSDGSSLNISSRLVSFDRFSAYDLKLSYEPERWLREWPTYIAMVFPRLDPRAYINSVPRIPILEGASYRGVEVNGQPYFVVSLLFDGLLALRDRSWHIINPRHPALRIPIPDESDIFLADNTAVSPDTALICLSKLLAVDPPSVLLKEE